MGGWPASSTGSDLRLKSPDLQNSARMGSTPARAEFVTCRSRWFPRAPEPVYRADTYPGFPQPLHLGKGGFG